MDRQDIDALLIGALYGELTPADEARLAAHLESHPADRSALDGLQVARDAVKQSRIFAVQADPPQAVSAILLQEAARRAPRTAPDPERREGWFQRFVRSFASHPAMAAAAMLVVVVGVAGTLYMRNGDQFAEKTASTPSATGEQFDTTRPAPPSGAVASENGAAQGADQVADQANDRAAKDNKEEVAAAGSAYNVALAEEQQLRKQTEVSDKPEPKVAAPAKPTAKPTAKTDPAASDGEFAKAPAHTGKKGYIEVTTPERTPKEMESKNDDVDTGKLARGDVSGGEAVGGAGGAPAGPAGARPETVTTAAAPPPPPADEAPRSKAAPAPQKTAVAKAPAQAAPPPQAQAQPQAPATNSPLLAWAKSQHAEAVARVRKGDCSGAASIAVQVRNRAPDYFAQNMRDDRELKSCTAYITDAVDKEERANTKAKASKRATDSK